MVFLTWHDDDVDDRWKVVINELVDHIDHLHAEKVWHITGENQVYNEAKKPLMLMKRKKQKLQILATALFNGDYRNRGKYELGKNYDFGFVRYRVMFI